MSKLLKSITAEQTDRAGKSAKNMAYSMICQSAFVILNFLVRMTMIKVLGKEAVSLNGLFTEVISVLSLAELGVGSAITYSLYKPLADNDVPKLQGLMTLFKKAYITISLVMTTIGLCLLPVIQNLVTKVDINISYLRLVYVLFLFKTSVSYLFSYKTALINADQRAFLISLCNFITKVVFSIIEIIAIIIGHNFCLYLVLEILYTVGTNVMISCMADKLYPFLREKGEVDPAEKKKIFENIKHLFISSLSGKITSSTDNILISLIVGTLSVGSYSQYSMINNGVSQVLIKAIQGTAGSVGNIMATESKSHCDWTLRRLTFFASAITGFCTCCVLACSTPFIVLCFGEDYALPTSIVCVCAFNLYLMIVREPLFSFIRVSGEFKRDKYISIIGSTFNLIISIVLGTKIGMLGIFLGTTATHLIQVILKIILLYNRNFKLSKKDFAGLFTKCVITTSTMYFVIIVAGKYLVVSNAVLQIIINLCIASLCFAAGTYILFSKTEEYRETKNYCLQKIRKNR